MQHRHLNHQRLTLAAIDDLLERGDLNDWIPIWQAIRQDPWGSIAERVQSIAERGMHYGADSLFLRRIKQARQHHSAAAKIRSPGL